MMIYIAPFVVLLFIIFGFIYKKINHLKIKQKIGVSWLRTLAVVLNCIQQHRGLSTMHLKGDSKIGSKVIDLQNMIKEGVAEINQVDAWIRENENWKSICDHWGRLEVNYKKNTPENNIEQHSKIIKNILYVIEEMAEEHCLLQLPNIESLGYDFAWIELLEAIEYIGQARALGTGVVASGSCNSVDRIRLNYLKDKIKMNTNRMENQFSEPKTTNPSIASLLSCLETQIIDNKFSVSSSDYFEIATKAINNLYSEYNHIVGKFKAAL